MTRRIAVLALATASCLGSNAPGDDLESVLARTPDRGRTAIDPVVRGVLTITFDDGPSVYTKDIVDVLGRHRVHGTFFVVGRNIAGRRDVLEYIRRGGHQLANHSFNHDAQTLLSEKSFKHGVLAVSANIDGRDNGRLFFRFPYGAADEAQLRWLSELDIDGHRYRPVGWHVDSHDFEYDKGYPDAERSVAVATGLDASCGGAPNPFADDMLGWTQFVARRSGGGVMLFHDTNEITRDKIDAVLTAFESPERYWAELPPDRQATYGRFYDCAGADRLLRFEFRPLDDGTYPALHGAVGD
ncbi:MAG: polysaccharide deacetylase family protein [Labilithrix sp.]|nr:polysaccharide deacetylase family protein [Labilithrix sp.]MBX3213885.1 polysaccharide deacetylase family protein [Labilithrix sp.]